MTVDFEMLERLVASGASGAVVLAYLREEHARQAGTASSEPLRARLFREGSAALVTMGRTEKSARALIASWLKATNDAEQLVLDTILRAQKYAIVEPASWINASLGALNGKPHKSASRSLAQAGDDLITLATARASERAANGHHD